MRNATVRLWYDDRKRISRMAVAGRPTPHTFAANEGSHVTPWAVFADSVRRGIIGHRAKSTIDHVRELIDALDDTERTEAKRLPTEQSSAFDTAADRAWEALEAFEAKPADLKNLEAAIAYYLTARNLAPLAAVFLGEDAAKGRGEGKILNKLRAYEEGNADYTDSELARLLVDLLDTKTIEYLGSGAKPKFAPGATGDPATDKLAAVVAHLAELSRAYPLAYEASRLCDTSVFNKYFAGTQVATAYELPETEFEWGQAARDWSPAGQRVCLVDLTLTKGVITSVEFEGRGNTLLNEQGHHVTAHVAVEQAVRMTLVNQLPKAALTRLLDLCAKTESLATWRELPKKQSADPKGILSGAHLTFDAAVTSARLVWKEEASTERDYVTEIEGLAGAYVMMRNALPMAAVRRGALANAKAEGRAMTLLREWASQERTFDADQVCWTLWRLFDGEALQELADEDGDLADLAPLAPTEVEERMYQVLSVHLDTIETAFPTLASDCAMRSTDSVAWVFQQNNLGMPMGCAKRLKLADKRVSPKTPFKAANESDHDQGEWKAQTKTRRTRGRKPRK